LARTGRRVFYFYIFSKSFFTEIYFRFHGFIPLPSDRRAAGGLPPICGAAGPLPGGRGLYVIKICVSSHGDPYRPARGLPPGRGTSSPPI